MASGERVNRSDVGNPSNDLWPLQGLPTQALREMSSALGEVGEGMGLPRRRIEQALGPLSAARLLPWLEGLVGGGWTLAHLGQAAGAVGYAVYNGRKLFRRLFERMAASPGLEVRIFINIERRRGDTTLDSEVVRRFVDDFRRRQWPWSPLPDLYYDPRSLSTDGTRASLHAKIALADRRATLITSANLTEAAQKRNVEAGVLITYAPFVARVADYVDGLRNSMLTRVPMQGPV